MRGARSLLRLGPVRNGSIVTYGPLGSARTQILHELFEDDFAGNASGPAGWALEVILRSRNLRAASGWHAIGFAPVGMTTTTTPSATKQPKLLSRLETELRLRHRSRRTIEAYIGWVRRFILFHRKRHPSDMAGPEVAAFLSHLAVDGHVSASTQNQALAALLFLYNHVLRTPLGHVDAVHASRPARLPVVLTRDEVKRVLAELRGTPRLIVSLLDGAGLRLSECLGLRVKDVDIERRQITIRRGKGQKDRLTVLPDSTRPQLVEHLGHVRRVYEADLTRGYGAAPLPDALDRKYPNAATEWPWQFVFPATRICRDPSLTTPSRFHLHETAVQRAITDAVRGSGITKRASAHTKPFVCDASARRRLRHSHGPGTARPRRCVDDDDLP